LLGHYAGFISRFLALVLDTFLISITFIALTWFVSVTTTMLQLRSFLGFSINRIPGSEAFIEAIFGPLGGSLLTAAYITTYHVFFWVLTGQTPGKALLGLRIVTLQGKRLSPLRGLLRFAAYFVSALPLLLGFLWVLADDRRQAWHDKIARTCVVYTWDARPDERFLVEEIRRLPLETGSPASAEAASPERDPSKG
jgi:uncharacterized RDD family membrane protein YckC